MSYNERMLKETITVAFCTRFVPMMLNIFLVANYPVLKVQAVD